MISAATANKAYTNDPSLPEPENPNEHTALEITGTDRPGLFSEISAALADLHCNIVEAHAWSHNARLACVAYISDQSTDTPIDDPRRLASIEDHLTTVLRATTGRTRPGQQQVTNYNEVNKSTTMTNVERRLHQLMLSVRDFDAPLSPNKTAAAPVGLESGRGQDHHRDHDHDLDRDHHNNKTTVRIESCEEKGYSIVSVESRDRRRLMFDTVCTLTDMHYSICHASLNSNHGVAYQVYIYIIIAFYIYIYY